MPTNQPTVDDVTTTNTVDVWRNKLYREEQCVFRELLAPFSRSLSPYHGIACLQVQGRVALPLGPDLRAAVCAT